MATRATSSTPGLAPGTSMAKLNKLPVTTLKLYLNMYHLPQGGNKKNIVRHLYDHLQEPPSEAATSESTASESTSSRSLVTSSNADSSVGRTALHRIQTVASKSAVRAKGITSVMPVNTASISPGKGITSVMPVNTHPIFHAKTQCRMNQAGRCCINCRLKAL